MMAYSVLGIMVYMGIMAYSVLVLSGPIVCWVLLVFSLGMIVDCSGLNKYM